MTIRKTQLGLGIVLLFFFLTSIAGLHELNIYTPDCGRYILWANSLASGNGFKDISEPEVQRYVVHSPLYSLLLVPSQWLFPNSIEAAKATTIIIGMIAIVLFFSFLRLYFNEQWALCGTVFFAFHPLTINYSTQLLTEIPFVVALLSVFILMKKYLSADNPSFYLKLGLILASVLCVVIREVGVVCAMAIIGYLYIEKKKKESIVLLLLVVFVYGSWVYRNEIVVATVENPLTRNSKIFTTNLYTSPNTPMWEEYYTRIVTNTKMYASMFQHMALTHVFRHPLNKQLFYSEPPLSWFKYIATVFSAVGPPIFLVLFIGGMIYFFLHKAPLFFLYITVIIFILVVLFIYPITDLRFLYPMFPMVLLFSLYGLRIATLYLGKFWKYSVIMLIAVVTLLSIPNVLWSLMNQWTSYRYSRDPSVFEDREHEYFSRSLRLAGKWLNEHTMEGDVVITKWNELFLFMDKAKVKLISTAYTGDELDEMIRDYKVRYIVAGLKPDKSNEHLTLFVQSRKYNFIPVYKRGSIEIREVVFKSDVIVKTSLATSEYEKDFNKALSFLEDHPMTSLYHFLQMAIKYKSIDNIYYIGIANLFLDSLDAAERHFKKFLYLQQGGAYLKAINTYLSIIDFLRLARTDTVPARRSNYYHNAAFHLWYSGYQYRSQLILEKAISEDPTFFPVLITMSVFSFQRGDTITSQKYLEKAKPYAPSNTLVVNMEKIHRYCDSLKHAVNPHQRLNIHIGIAKSYYEMGFINAAIDELYLTLKEFPTSTEARELLAQFYMKKKRYYTAYKYYEQLEKSVPDNPAYKEARESIKRFIF